VELRFVSPSSTPARLPLPGLEFDPLHVDVIVGRFEAETGKQAQHSLHTGGAAGSIPASPTTES
jgi:hypothetical protein